MQGGIFMEKIVSPSSSSNRQNKKETTIEGINFVSSLIEEIQMNNNNQNVDTLKLYQNLINILAVIIRNLDLLKKNEPLTMTITDGAFFFEAEIELGEDGNSIKSLKFSE